MAVLPFLIMDSLQAARLRELTMGVNHALDPRLIENGVYKGKYALPQRIKVDPNYEANRDAFALLTEVALDVDLAWPPAAEDPET